MKTRKCCPTTKIPFESIRNLDNPIHHDSIIDDFEDEPIDNLGRKSTDIDFAVR